jgi:hypothetical protein
MRVNLAMPLRGWCRPNVFEWEENMKRLLAMVVMALGLSGCAGCSNPETGAGWEGYVKKGALFGQARFYGTQTGPMSTGIGWMLEVDNIDMQWRTINEEFDVMSADNLSLKFHAHVVMRPKSGSVKLLVELYGGGWWYDRVIQQPFRNAVYEAVSGLNALEAKARREEMSKVVHEKLAAYVANMPFEIQSVVIGVINLPGLVAQAQEQKITKETQLEQKRFEIDIAKQDAQVRIEEAKGIAESQKIINTTLTPLYLQHEAIKAQFEMSRSQNHTTVYIPSGSNGIPLIKGIE